MAESTRPEVMAFADALRRMDARAPVTLALIAINVVVFAAMAVAGAGILESNSEVHVRWGSNLTPVTVDGEWWRLGTSMFLHFGIVHLLVNMWVLYVNGRLVERMFGSVRYLVLYLFAGLLGSLASTAWHPATNSAGASGAIFGVIGGMMAFFVSKKSRVPREVLQAQGRSIAVFAVYNIAFGLAYPGIDNAAHLGGAVGGFLAGLVLARPLTPEARAESKPAYLAGAVFVAAVILGASIALVLYLKERMSPQDRFTAAMVWFEYGEPKALAAYNEMVASSHAGNLPQGRFADRLNAETVAFYAAAQLRFSDTQDASGLEGRMLDYLGARLRAFSTLDKALRQNDLTLGKEARRLQAEADFLAQSLNARAAQPESP